MDLTEFGLRFHLLLQKRELSTGRKRPRDNGRMAEERPSMGAARKLLPYTSVLLILAGLYVGWVFFSRWRDNKAAEEAVAAKKAAQNKKVVDQVFGSGSVKLLSFSVSQTRLHRGETTNLCYGVANAVSVAIDPHIENIKPTYNRCLQIQPKQTTTYTLTAKDAAGHAASGSLTITVQ
jgi:hypothetical protein